MAATRRPSRRPLLTACACALLCGACLPIAHTVTLSPAIEGTYRHEDGTPMAGAPLALSTAYNDSTCANPSHRTTTDTAGRFAFPATRHRQRYILLLPYDALFGYTICGGEPPTTTLYSTSYMHRVPAYAYVTCTRLTVPEPTTRRRTHCTSSRRPRRRTARRWGLNGTLTPGACAASGAPYGRRARSSRSRAAHRRSGTGSP
jgi:hypothetical protein